MINKNIVDKKITAAIFTLGCRVNQYESRAMAERLASAGAEIREGGSCDLYIINTCAVTAESERKARQLIRRCVSLNPRAVVAVCGCASQLRREEIASIEGVDLVFGSADKNRAAEAALSLATMRAEGAISSGFDASPTFDIYKNEWERGAAVTGFDRVRAYIKIEDGCGGRCAYCVIPALRGPARSRPPEDILREAEALAASGCRELVLTGIETAAYSHGLAELLAAIDSLPGAERIRLGSMDPAFLKPEFADKLASLRHFMPHLHVSLQSGSSRVLAAMRRRYGAETAAANLRYLRSVIPAIRFSADIIVGFPGETKDEFEETLSFARAAEFLHMHIFIYSKRPGTEAASMPGQIAPEEKNRRATLLAQLGRQIKAELLDKTIAEGNAARVLLENKKGGFYYGHAEDFTEYRVADPGADDFSGKAVTLRPVSRDGDIIEGIKIEE